MVRSLIVISSALTFALSVYAQGLLDVDTQWIGTGDINAQGVGQNLVYAPNIEVEDILQGVGILGKGEYKEGKGGNGGRGRGGNGGGRGGNGGGNGGGSDCGGNGGGSNGGGSNGCDDYYEPQLPDCGGFKKREEAPEVAENNMEANKAMEAESPKGMNKGHAAKAARKAAATAKQMKRSLKMKA